VNAMEKIVIRKLDKIETAIACVPDHS